MAAGGRIAAGAHAQAREPWRSHRPGVYAILTRESYITTTTGGLEVAKIGDLYQEADWKAEKHAPVLECPASASADQAVTITASVGKEIAHPNTTEHHIAWIEIHFKPDSDKFAHQLSVNRFTAHGESVKGANEGAAFTEPFCQATVKFKESGTVFATSYCNIHGLWESSARIEIS
jgi:superoxide reductase